MICHHTIPCALTALFSPLPVPHAITKGHRQFKFLWYFPYPCERSPLATTILCAARTFLSDNHPCGHLSDCLSSSHLSYHISLYESICPPPTSPSSVNSKCLSIAKLTSLSATSFCSRFTWTNAIASKFFSNLCISS